MCDIRVARPLSRPLNFWAPCVRFSGKKHDKRTDQFRLGQRALLAQEDQEELVELAREKEARRTGIYVMNDEDRAAVREGMEQAMRGEFVPDDEMEAFWKKYGVL